MAQAQLLSAQRVTFSDATRYISRRNALHFPTQRVTIRCVGHDALLPPARPGSFAAFARQRMCKRLMPCPAAPLNPGKLIKTLLVKKKIRINGLYFNYYSYLYGAKVYYLTIMDDIYTLADTIILNRVGSHLKAVRLRQNITQQSLADAAGISLSTLKKIEKGEIGSFDSLLRVLRTLGKLDVLLPLVEEEQLSPSEYYHLVQSNTARHQRQRAAGRLNNTDKEESAW